MVIDVVIDMAICTILTKIYSTFNLESFTIVIGNFSEIIHMGVFTELIKFCSTFDLFDLHD